MSTVININGPNGIRRRAAAMSSEGVGSSRTTEDNETISPNEMFMFIYVPTLLNVLSLVEIVLGCLYSHWWGVAVASVALGGSIWMVWKHPKALEAGWGRIAAVVLLLYVVALLLIRVASMRGALEIAKDPATMRADVFPHGCDTAKLQGCARVAESSSYPDPSVPVPEYAVYMHHALGAVEEWIEQQRGVAVIVKRVEDGASIVGAGKSHCSVFLHLRAMSLFMGFIDDMYIQMECLPRSVVQFSVQSQLRIGISDLGVNEARIKRLLRFVAAKLALVGHGDCTKNMDVVST